MAKKLGISAIVISGVSFCLSAAGLFVNVQNNSKEDTRTQYVMYVGTNDKDTYKPEHSKEEAKEIVDKICLDYFEGYTIQEAAGSWMDEKKNITHEYTIVCYFDDADPEKVYKAADEIIDALNQNTVLIEKSDIQMEYYSHKSAGTKISNNAIK